jgi:hypothetical protein
MILYICRLKHQILGGGLCLPSEASGWYNKSPEIHFHVMAVKLAIVTRYTQSRHCDRRKRSRLAHCPSQMSIIYEGRLKISWTHLITPSRNFVEMRWRPLFRSTSLGKRCTSYNAPPTSWKRAADRWSLRNSLPGNSLFMVGKKQKSHGTRSELNYVFALKKVDRWNPIRTSAIQSRSRPVRFLGFSNHKNGVPRQEISKWSTVFCSTFSRSWWSVVRNASLAKGGTSKRRPSPHLHTVPTRSDKVSPRTLQTVFVYSD